MERVVVTIPIVNICTMQVCALKEATDEEILAVCNKENPAGTENGWSTVIREVDKSNIFKGKNKIPVPCDDYPDRLHILVLC
jgi:hypothetical protein